MRDALLTNRTRRAQIVSILTGGGSLSRDAVVVASVAALVSAGGLAACDATTFAVYNNAAGSSDCSITSGLKVLTSPNDLPWTAADVGKAITVQGAGVAGAPLESVIDAFTSAGQVTLRHAASTTVTSTASSIAGVAIWGNPVNATESGSLIDSSGNKMRTYLPSVVGGGSRAYGNIFSDEFNVKDFNAKGDGTADDSASIQSAIDACIAAGGGVVFFPAGRYRCASRIKVQNTYASNKQVTLAGAGAGWQNVPAASTYGSLLVGETGGILLDCAGGSNITIRDLGMFAGVSNPSTIGILFQRIATSQYCQNVRMQRVTINMGTNAAANGGLGTFGIVNKRGEHWHIQDLSAIADRAVLLDGRSQYPTLISPDYAESVPAGGSLTNNWYDACIMYSYIGDCIEIQTASQIALRGGSFISGTGKGMAAIFSGTNISLVDFQFESGSATPTYLVDILNTCQNLTIKGSSATILPIKGVQCASAGRTIKGLTAEFAGNFGLVIDTAAGTGGPVNGCFVRYDTSAGHSIPAGTGEGIYGIFQQEGGSPRQYHYNVDTVEVNGDMRIPVVLTASLPAAGTANDKKIIIEDGGAGNGNLIIYVGGQRFRIDGGAPF